MLCCINRLQSIRKMKIVNQKTQNISLCNDEMKCLAIWHTINQLIYFIFAKNRQK